MRESLKRTYEIPEGKRHIFDGLVATIEESVTSEIIGFVDVLRARNWVKHRSNDDIRIDHCKIEDWLLLFYECPLRSLALANAIKERRRMFKRTAAFSPWTLPAL